ncbi:UNVERIFIED_CONTAM: hypothetical protein RMT77_005492 [Armadillidium vulgare]
MGIDLRIILVGFCFLLLFNVTKIFSIDLFYPYCVDVDKLHCGDTNGYWSLCSLHLLPGSVPYSDCPVHCLNICEDVVCYEPWHRCSCPDHREL